MITRTSSHAGFTIVELVTAMAILSVLLALAIPSFQSTVANQRVRTDTNDLLMTMLYARSEAVKRNTTVNVIPANADWNEGWCVYLNTVVAPVCPYTGDITAADAPLRQQDAPEGVIIGADAVIISFGASGRITGNNPTFTLCDTYNRAHQRSLTIGLTGSPVVTKGDMCGS